MTFDPRLQRGLWDAFKLSGSEAVAVNQIERLTLNTAALGPEPALPGPRCFVAAVCVLAHRLFAQSKSNLHIEYRQYSIYKPLPSFVSLVLYIMPLISCAC